MSTLTPKPKVVAAVVGGIIASAILSNITLITPDLFDGLGKASGLVYGLTITLIMGLCGWLKSEGASAPAGDTPSVPQSEPSRAPGVYPAAAVDAAETQAKIDAILSPADPAAVTPAPTPTA